MKKLLMIPLIIVLLITSVGCNKQIFDTTYTFNRAVLTLPNGEIIDGKVTSWSDFADGDQIQVKIDGKTYLVHSTNITLITE